MTRYKVWETSQGEKTATYIKASSAKRAAEIYADPRSAAEDGWPMPTRVSVRDKYGELTRWAVFQVMRIDAEQITRKGKTK